MDANTSSDGSPTDAIPHAASNVSAAVKMSYSAPVSPVSLNVMDPSSPHPGRASNNYSSPVDVLTTPKRNLFDSVLLETAKKKLLTPEGICELQSLRLNSRVDSAVNFVKERYLIYAKPKHISASSFAKKSSSYRHMVDINMSNLKCTDIFSGEEFQCKVVNQPLHKVQQAYFMLKQETSECRSSIYGHRLIRDIKDIVRLNKHRTYVILANPQPAIASDDSAIIFDDLHTYLRGKHRLCEAEARSLFHQICETVLICHRNGIILRDLKLKRFFFVDEARTKLQYESLEGSMILDNPDDDTLTEKIGCPLYTAPELLCPEPTYKGKPADMWALGVILYTMLAGQYPFFEKGNSNLVTIIRQCFVQLPGHISRSARWLLLTLLRKNISDRVPIEYIFLSPWLKDQKPLHMYIPVGVKISDDNGESSFSSSLNCIDVSEEDGIQPLDYSCKALSMNCGDPNAEMG